MGNSRGGAFGSEPRTNASRNYDRDRPLHETAGKLWKFVEPTSRKRVLELEVLTFDESEILETQTGCNQKVGKTAALAGTDNTDHRYRLLRAPAPAMPQLPHMQSREIDVASCPPPNSQQRPVSSSI